MSKPGSLMLSGKRMTGGFFWGGDLHGQGHPSPSSFFGRITRMRVCVERVGDSGEGQRGPQARAPGATSMAHKRHTSVGRAAPPLSLLQRRVVAMMLDARQACCFMASPY